VKTTARFVIPIAVYVFFVYQEIFLEGILIRVGFPDIP